MTMMPRHLDGDGATMMTMTWHSQGPCIGWWAEDGI